MDLEGHAVDNRLFGDASLGLGGRAEAGRTGARRGPLHLCPTNADVIATQADCRLRVSAGPSLRRHVGPGRSQNRQCGAGRVHLFRRTSTAVYDHLVYPSEIRAPGVEAAHVGRLAGNTDLVSLTGTNCRLAYSLT